MSCGEPDAQEWASPVRRAGRGNGPAVTPAPRPGPTQRLRLREPTRLSTLSGEPPELDQPRLLLVQPQPEPREPLAQRGPEPLSVTTMLEAHHEVVRVTHGEHLATRLLTTPLVDPEIEDVMQVHVRQQRRD